MNALTHHTPSHSNALALEISSRSAYLRLKPGYQTQLATIWSIIRPEMNRILDEFYTHIRKEPNLASLFEGRDLGRIKQAQYNHWEKMFTEGFNHDYEQRVTRIGMAHAQIGLSGRWFFGAYCLILNRITVVISKKYRLKPAQADAMNELFQQAVFMDMDAINAVYDHLVKVRHDVDRKSLMDGLISSFDTDVAGQISSVAAASEELSSSAVAIGEQARSVRDIAGEAQTLGMRARDVNTRLTQATEEIETVVGMIQTVAQQTNLLALNASIEAARAGEHGRGFGVVADEVKKLAHATGTATDDIKAKINEIQGAVNSSVTAADKITQAIERISGSAEVISSSLTEQEQATGDISRGMTDVQNLIQHFFARLQTGARQTQPDVAVQHGLPGVVNPAGHIPEMGAQVQKLLN